MRVLLVPGSDFSLGPHRPPVLGRVPRVGGGCSCGGCSAFPWARRVRLARRHIQTQTKKRKDHLYIMRIAEPWRLEPGRLEHVYLGAALLVLWSVTLYGVAMVHHTNPIAVFLAWLLLVIEMSAWHCATV